MSSLLFENLQTMNEASKLEERNAFNPQTYIAIKRALNKENTYKDIIFLNTDLPSNPTDEFKFGLKVKCAIIPDVKDWQYDNNYDGRGEDIGTFIINTIDETIAFKPYYNGIEGAVERIVRRIQNQIPAEEVKAIIENGIANVEKLFTQKNFYYRLTNKANKHDKWSGNFNLRDENVEPKTEETETLTEDFDSSMPVWLMKAIRQDNSRYSRHNGSIYPLDTMKWEITAPPITGKLPNEMKDVIACLIDISGEDKRGSYLVYCPRLGLNIDGTIRINDRERRIETMSMKALAPYIKEYAVATNVPESKKDVTAKRDDRLNAGLGSVNRVKPSNQVFNRKYDKSGYIVDPEKYKKQLAQLHKTDYAERLEDLYTVLTDVKSKIKDYMASDDFLSDAKDDKSPYSVGFHTKSSKINEVIKTYNKAVTNYRYALEDLDKLGAGGTTGYWSTSPAYKAFDGHVKDAEEHTVAILNIIEK